MTNKDIKIYVAGDSGLVGTALKKQLKASGFENIIGKKHSELDLEIYEETRDYILSENPDVVFIAAAKVGGIHANNTYPVDFLLSNLSVQNNIIKSSYETKVQKLIFLGSSCIYPRDCPQPIKEEYLLSSELEPTNRPYALAKITGIELCWSFNRQYGTKYLAAMPTNLYGPNDNYNQDNSHVIPGLISKIHKAKIDNHSNVKIWGSGNPRREFLYSMDLANALIHIMTLPEDKFNDLTVRDKCPIINIGSGTDISIIELANLIKEVVGFEGKFDNDLTKPDGTYQKLLDSSKINKLGWHSQIELYDGLKLAYDNFLQMYK